MGGGDLNSKKSWHPNTLKNQELVWKAEQAAAQEKNRIAELQLERAQERDRAELNVLAKRGAGSASSTNEQLSWMYDKPNKKGNEEDYLLGKAVDGNFDRSEKQEQDTIGALSRRVVGSSSAGDAGDAQVDLARKMREDPLLLVKERERAARAALLNNPLHRRKLTELLRKEQEQRNKKKTKKKDKDLDCKLAEKLNALNGGKGIDLAALLASDDSSSSSDADSDSDKKPKKKKKKSKKSKHKEKAKSKKLSANETSCSEDTSPKRKMNATETGSQRSKEVTNRYNKIQSPNDNNSYWNNYKYSRNYDNEDEHDKGRTRKYRNERDLTPEQREYRKNRHLSPSRDISPRRKDERERDRSPWHRGESDRDKSPGRKFQRERDLSPKRRDQREREKSSKHNERERDRSPRHRGESERDRSSTHKVDRKRVSPRRRDEHERDRSPRRKDERDKSGDNRRSSSPEINREREYDNRKRKPDSPKPQSSQSSKPSKKGLSEEEKAARLAEMSRSGAEHEAGRARRVARARAAAAAEAAAPRAPRAAPAALPASLETRIHSNRHNIQRNDRHMSEHFARRH